MENERKKWQYAWIEGMITDDDFTKRMEENDTETLILEETMNELNVEEVIITEEDVKQEIKNIILNWKELSRKEKKMLLLEIIDEIEVRKDGTKVKVTDIHFL